MKPINTFATIQGREVDSVLVAYDTWPAEYDTNTAAGLEVVSVVEEDECILHLMSEDEIEELEQRLINDLSCEDDGYGDYLYDRMKDDRLTGDL